MTRQHSYETLGKNTNPLMNECTYFCLYIGSAVNGSVGKLAVELGNIGLGFGTCVGFYVIIGDLLPPLVYQIIGVDSMVGNITYVLSLNSCCVESSYP